MERKKDLTETKKNRYYKRIAKGKTIIELSFLLEDKSPCGHRHKIFEQS